MVMVVGEDYADNDHDNGGGGGDYDDSDHGDDDGGGDGYSNYDYG